MPKRNPKQKGPERPEKPEKDDNFSSVFNTLVNYWEIKPTLYEARLQDLALKDIRVVSAFVPWAHVETDIYHSLRKFVRAAYSARVGVRLFVMPELGVNYPNAGFPKDLLANVSNMAVDRAGRVIYNYSAPNVFSLPSFSAPEVLKRFGNYLIKVGSILGEVFAEVENSSFCEIVVSNTLFNYYRSYGLKLGDHGDYSAAHVMAFREFVDREYKEEQFKTQIYEAHSRHRFFTHVEKLLREKTDMVFARKNSTCVVRHVDLFNPEADPESAYHNLIVELFKFKPSLQRYYGSIVAGGYRHESIFLGSTGVFRRFSDQEKSFLMLAALIHSGEVGVLADELFKLSPNFQRKLRGLIDLLKDGRFTRQTHATYVSASKFSMEERSFGMFTKFAAGVLSVIGGLDSHRQKFSERLIFLDPRWIVRMVDLIQLLSSAQAGKVVVVPMPNSRTAVPNYTAEALEHFEKFKKGRQPLKLNIGLSYEVYEYHLGHVVFYDPHAFWTDSQSAPESALDNYKDELYRFFQALLGLADIHALCSVSDSRLHVASYASEEDPSQRLLFLINPTDEELQAKLGFEQLVRLEAFPQSSESGVPLVGKIFELSVPPLGVLSMRLYDASQTDVAGKDQPLDGDPKWI